MSTAEATETDWPSIAALYLRLEQLTGSPIVRLNRAVAVAEAEVATALLADHHLLPADCQPVRGRRIQLRR
jgi:RNA polymerase sigma-70 factor (ECF subfamily)